MSHIIQSVLAVGLAMVLVPAKWRPRGWKIPVVGFVVSYVALRIGHDTRFSEWLDHDVLEKIGGEIDDASTWVIACSAVIGVLWLAHRRRPHAPDVGDPPNEA